MTEDVVIVGGGQAALQTADSLRREKFAGRITLLSAEDHPPYQRPPLSKAFLSGDLEQERIYIRPDSYFTERDIDLQLSTEVTEIDRIGRVVRTGDDKSIPYDHLVLAVGARVRPLPAANVELAGIHYLRTLDDSLAIRHEFEKARRVAVIGGGFIGLEVGAVALKAGKAVTVIEMDERLMGRAVAPILSDYYLDVHRSHGGQILFGEKVIGFDGDGGRVTTVRCESGQAIEADLVVIGIGVVPNIELAVASGLPCTNGIDVDEFTRTEDPKIHAIGDCAYHPNHIFGRNLRLESVQNAVDQARVAAANIAGQERTYSEVPWFWSDQFDLKLQMVGLSAGHDDIAIRGRREDKKFSIFYFQSSRLIAIDSINRPADHMAGRKLLPAGARVTPEQAADESFNLKDLLN